MYSNGTSLVTIDDPSSEIPILLSNNKITVVPPSSNQDLWFSATILELAPEQTEDKEEISTEISGAVYYIYQNSYFTGYSLVIVSAIWVFLTGSLLLTCFLLSLKL